MSLIQVTARELNKGAENLRNLNARFRSEKETLTSCEQSLNTMWEGSAKDTFHTMFINDIGRMENFINAIEQYISALLVIVTNYEQAEARNTATANARKY